MQNKDFDYEPVIDFETGQFLGWRDEEGNLHPEHPTHPEKYLEPEKGDRIATRPENHASRTERWEKTFEMLEQGSFYADHDYVDNEWLET